MKSTVNSVYANGDWGVDKKGDLITFYLTYVTTIYIFL